MAVGDVKYGKYGLTQIDQGSSSTMVSSIDVDINDVGETNSVIMIQGSVQCDTDNTFINLRFLDASDSILRCSYRTKNSGTTSTRGASDGTSDFARLNYWGMGNQNNSVYDPIAGGLSSTQGAESMEFQVVLNSERSTSAPIRKFFGFYEALYYSNSPNLHFSRGGFEVNDDGAVRKVRIQSETSGALITGSIKVHSIFT